MLIYTHQKSKKKKKLNAKQRELKESWEALLKKYETKKPVPKSVKPLERQKPFVRETPHYPSLNSGYHDTSKKTVPTYTGTAMLGIGTLHKSNAVPIFSEEDAREQARMRRG